MVKGLNYFGRFPKKTTLTKPDGVGFKSPLPRLWLERQMGSGEDCLSLNDFRRRVPQPPRCGAKTKGNKRQWGALLFGYFLLSKQKQSNSQVARERHLSFHIYI
jgi:hypothetical protein